VRWGGADGIHPVGVLGACLALAVSPPLGALAAFVLVRSVRRMARRASRRWHDLAQAGQWATSATLAFSHGANDAQKSAGIVAALLLADGRIETLAAPLWATIACAAALTLGTAAGGWSIVRTVGRRIYHLHPVDGLCSQGASAAVILGASLVGAPTSTTQIVASSVVGVGAGRRRWHHVRWALVRHMGLAWIVTMPASAVIAALAFVALRWAS
jgi:PiT family inorganic phosphate transporter